jgi:hypothetical protein
MAQSRAAEIGAEVGPACVVVHDLDRAYRSRDVAAVDQQQEGKPGTGRSQPRKSVRAGDVPNRRIQQEATPWLRRDGFEPRLERRKGLGAQTRRRDELRERIPNRGIVAGDEYRRVCHASALPLTGACEARKSNAIPRDSPRAESPPGRSATVRVQ